MKHNQRGEIVTWLVLTLVVVGAVFISSFSSLVNNKKTGLGPNSRAQSQCSWGDWDCAASDCSSGDTNCICSRMGKSFCAPGDGRQETGNPNSVCVRNQWDTSWGCWAQVAQPPPPTTAPTSVSSPSGGTNCTPGTGGSNNGRYYCCFNSNTVLPYPHYEERPAGTKCDAAAGIVTQLPAAPTVTPLAVPPPGTPGIVCFEEGQIIPNAKSICSSSNGDVSITCVNGQASKADCGIVGLTCSNGLCVPLPPITIENIPLCVTTDGCISLQDSTLTSCAIMGDLTYLCKNSQIIKYCCKPPVVGTPCTNCHPPAVLTPIPAEKVRGNTIFITNGKPFPIDDVLVKFLNSSVNLGSMDPGNVSQFDYDCRWYNRIFGINAVIFYKYLGKNSFFSLYGRCDNNNYFTINN